MILVQKWEIHAKIMFLLFDICICSLNPQKHLCVISNQLYLLGNIANISKFKSVRFSPLTVWTCKCVQHGLNGTKTSYYLKNLTKSNYIDPLVHLCWGCSSSCQMFLSRNCWQVLGGLLKTSRWTLSCWILVDNLLMPSSSCHFTCIQSTNTHPDDFIFPISVYQEEA